MQEKEIRYSLKSFAIEESNEKSIYNYPCYNNQNTIEKYFDSKKKMKKLIIQNTR